MDHWKYIIGGEREVYPYELIEDEVNGEFKDLEKLRKHFNLKEICQRPEPYTLISTTGPRVPCLELFE